MKKWIALLVFLLTSISITGLSLIDNLILARIVASLVSIAFFIVSLMYKIGVIDSKSEGSKAFKGVFVILLILALTIYLGIRRFQEWFLTSPMYVKIIIPSVLGLLIIGVIILIIHDHFINEEYVD